MSSPITSVSQSHQPLFTGNVTFGQNSNTPVRLSVRGKILEINRDELTTLPESILLCLFPNGLLLDEHDDNPVTVDFDPDTLSYTLAFFRSALENPPTTTTSPLGPGKSAIIVLKEDLDFYIIPPSFTTPSETTNLRHSAGNFLISSASIFEGLRKQGQKNFTGTAEQHLIDMLCSSGFDASDDWSKRVAEPSKACITSLALAMLSQTEGSTATSQKLLLFWRKPARKCWWDSIEPDELQGSDGPVKGVKIWARRVWTLELSITG